MAASPTPNATGAAPRFELEGLACHVEYDSTRFGGSVGGFFDVEFIEGGRIVWNYPRGSVDGAVYEENGRNFSIDLEPIGEGWLLGSISADGKRLTGRIVHGYPAAWEGICHRRAST